MGKQVPADRRRDFSVREICYELSVSRDWIEKRLGTPEVPPYIRRGKFLLFPREKFVEWKRRQPIFGDLTGEQNV
jgi:hypothetical protein